MTRCVPIVMTVMTLLVAAPIAWSKGAIIRIVIDAEALASPVEIVDAEVLDRFTIWSGPGVVGWDMLRTVPNPGDAEFLIDWTQGIVTDLTHGSTHCRVTMFLEGREAPRDTYEVLYQIDDRDGKGYVYLPSNADDFGRWNTFQIYRQVEGHWFRATQEWELIVRPLLEQR